MAVRLSSVFLSLQGVNRPSPARLYRRCCRLMSLQITRVCLLVISLSVAPEGMSGDRADADMGPEVITESGFSYRFRKQISIQPGQNIYTVGQHCYRGDPVRFSVPAERFTLMAGDLKHDVFGRSVWNRFYVDSRWNFILNSFDAGYWVVALEGDACADVILDIRYETARLLQEVRGLDVAVGVHDKRGILIGTFSLLHR